MSKLIETLTVVNFLNYNFEEDGFYFPLFLDFRGRKYYDSLIGPTISKHLRLAYYYGYYTADDFKNQIFSPNINRYKTEIYNFSQKFNFFCNELTYPTLY
jgi:hypothetical protein